MKILLAKLISQIFLLPYRFNSRISIGRGVIANNKLKIKGPGRVILHEGVNLWAHAEPTEIFTFSPEAVVEIGKNSRLNGSTLQARESISIGENCLLGSTLILDNDFHNPDPALRHDPTKIPSQAIRIANNVWIAGQTVILKGVEIGENSVVGIRSVVSKKVEANTVVAGNPAKKVKDLSEQK